MPAGMQPVQVKRDLYTLLKIANRKIPYKGGYSKSFGDGFRHFESWSSDEDVTRAGNPF
ncbi:hypothetical protein TNCV_2234841 [Trichonephila clavipes]|nr:hypothetical protein TNCV_2234841 [Trichonephila clavipes]